MKRLLLLAFALTIMSSDAPAAETQCNRQCMSRLLDRYLSAVAAHKPEAAPLAPNFRATENGLDVPAGMGLWQTATGYGPMQRRYFDPASGQAAFYGVVHEASGPALLSLRLRIDGRSVVESESIIARQSEPLYNPDGAIADQPRPDDPLPREKRSSRDSLLKTATAYFDALQGGNPGAVGKIDGCERVENGTKVTNRTASIGGSAAGAGEERGGDCTVGIDKFPIAKVAHRRFPVIDTEAGVILGIGLFHRPPGAVSRDGTPRKRNLIHEFFAMDNGRIAEIFAVMRYRESIEADSTGW